MTEIKLLEKLRESSHLDDNKWTLENGDVVITYGHAPDGPNAVNWGEQWREIADEIEREIAERFMECPVDADGLPIKLGDRVSQTDGEYSDTFVVEGYTSEFPEGEGRVLVVNDQDDGYYADSCRHVKPRTIEDVLREFANEVWETSVTCQTTWSDSGLDGIEERYAAEIREMMGKGADYPNQRTCDACLGR